MTTGAWASEIRGAFKTFDMPTIDHLSRNIRKGELYALLGLMAPAR